MSESQPFYKLYLQPLKKFPNPKEIVTFDIEATKWKDFAIAGVYDGKDYSKFASVAELLKFLLQRKFAGKLIFAHVLKYDGEFILDFLSRNRDFSFTPIINGGKLLEIKIRDIHKHVWRFRDSYSLLPASLKDLTKSFDVEHKKLDEDEKGMLTNPEYNRNDCMGLYEVLLKFRAINGGFFGMTISQTALSIFRMRYQKFPIRTVREVEPILRKAFYGGRTEIFKYNLNMDKRFYYYDVTSLYPSVMRDFEYPYGEFKLVPPDVDKCGFSYAVADDTCYFPVLPQRIGGKMMFLQGKKEGWYSNQELKHTANTSYGGVEIKSTLACDDFDYLFRDFVDDMFKIRQEAKANGNSALDYTQKILLNCFSHDTDIMTSEGLKRVGDVKEGESVYSLNPVSGKTELKKVVNTFKYEYHERMVSIKQSKLDFLVTPNHRFLIKDWWKDNLYFKEADKLTYGLFPVFKPMEGVKSNEASLFRYIRDDEWLVLEMENKYDHRRDWNKIFEYDHNFRQYRIKKCDFHKTAEHFSSMKFKWKPYGAKYKGSGIDYVFKTDDLFELAGWYVSEGSLCQNGIAISQKEGEKKEMIRGLLDRMGLRFSEKGLQIYIFHRLIRDFMVENFGKDSYEKFISNHILSHDSSHLWHLFNSMMLGDGSWKLRSPKSYQSFKYSTVSEKLAHDFQRLCLHLGKRTKVVREDYKYNTFTKKAGTIFRVFIYRQETVHFKAKHIDKNVRNNSDYVYCIEVEDNHTVLAGRNGRLEWSGQSSYGKWGQKRQKEQIVGNPQEDFFIEEGMIPDMVGSSSVYKKIIENDSPHIIPSLSALITANARLVMHRYLLGTKPEHIYYMDTDSLITDVPAFQVGDELGKFKLECEMTEFLAVLPKVYHFKYPSGRHCIKAKGLHLNYKDSDEVNVGCFKEFISGHEVIDDRGIEGFKRACQLQKKTGDNTLLFNKAMKKSMHSYYDKRRLMPDQDLDMACEPFKVGEDRAVNEAPFKELLQRTLVCLNR
jgi:hypothetical protein